MDTEKPNTKNKKKLTFIDLFSGAGGIGIGFERAGFKQIFSADFDAAVAKTFRHNNPKVVHISYPKIEPVVIGGIKFE
jgi:site-specific DNA-cytosine methylase